MGEKKQGMAAPEKASTIAPPDALGQAGRALGTLLLVGEQFRLRTAEHFEIGLSDIRAMSYLQVGGGSLSPAQLARRLYLTSSALTALLDRLASADLVSRAPDQKDRRKTVVTVTAHGHELLAQVEDWMTGALATVDPALIDDATTILTALGTSLQTQTDDLYRARQFAEGS